MTPSVYAVSSLPDTRLRPLEYRAGINATPQGRLARVKREREHADRLVVITQHTLTHRRQRLNWLAQRRCAVLLLGLSFFGPEKSMATDVEVVYRVTGNPLRSGATATSPLTLQISIDSACSGAVLTETIDLAQATLIERVKLVRLSGAPPPPQIAALHFLVTDVALTGAAYAKITGKGITPFGNACQLQNVASNGGAGVPTTVIKDSNGAIVGPYSPGLAGFETASSTPYVIRNFDDRAVDLPLVEGATSFADGAGFYYTSSDCSGQRLVSVFPTDAFLLGQVRGTNAYIYPQSGASVFALSQSYAPYDQAYCTPPNLKLPPDGCCSLLGETLQLGPPMVMDLNTFAPPFHAEAE